MMIIKHSKQQPKALRNSISLWNFSFNVMEEEWHISRLCAQLSLLKILTKLNELIAKTIMISNNDDEEEDLWKRPWKWLLNGSKRPETHQKTVITIIK